MSACIEHTQKGNRGGYGATTIKGRTYALHRLTYANSVGVDITALSGVVVRHTCDNPRCINPDHLIAGTQADNIRDRVERGRGRVPKGEAHHANRLTATQVWLIRNRYIPRCKVNGTHALAKEFDVHQSVISRIVNNRIWRVDNDESKV